MVSTSPGIFVLAEIAFLIAFGIPSILISGFLIWLGLRVIGKKRSFLKCVLANLAAFVTAFIIHTMIALFILLYFTPNPIYLIMTIPIYLVIYPLIYLYVLKTLLDISFIEALAAMIVALIVLLSIAVTILIISGIWLIPTVHPSLIPFYLHRCPIASLLFQLS